MKSSKKNSIVVFDDDEELLEIVSSLLISEGYSVNSFSSPSFVQKLAQIQPDLILVDVWFDDYKDGITFSQAVQHSEKTKSVSVIMMSSDPDLAEYAELVKPSAWIQKPIDFSDLIQTIEKVLK